MLEVTELSEEREGAGLNIKPVPPDVPKADQFDAAGLRSSRSPVNSNQSNLYSPRFCEILARDRPYF